MEPMGDKILLLERRTVDFSHFSLLPTNAELREIATAMEKYIKFFLLLFAKLMFDHGTGIVTFGGLLLTFYNANSVVRQQGRYSVLSWS